MGETLAGESGVLEERLLRLRFVRGLLALRLPEVMGLTGTWLLWNRAAGIPRVGSCGEVETNSGGVAGSEPAHLLEPLCGVLNPDMLLDRLRGLPPDAVDTRVRAWLGLALGKRRCRGLYSCLLARHLWPAWASASTAAAILGTSHANKTKEYVAVRVQRATVNSILCHGQWWVGCTCVF